MKIALPFPTVRAVPFALLAFLGSSLAPAAADSVAPAAPQVAAASTAAAPVVAPTYQIRPGDTLSVTVFNEPTLTQPALRVLQGGTIAEPLAGQVRVGGMTPAEASDAVARALMKFVRHPQVTVAVALVGPADVYVLGNVKTPGKYQLQPEGRLMDALAAAGGLGPTDGDLPDARLSVGADVKAVSLQKLLHGGDLSLNVPIANDMTVYVPAPITFTVQVNGAVDHPGDVPMHEGDRLINAIARAGSSPSASSDLNAVVVIHTNPDGTQSHQTVNLYDIYKNGEYDKNVLLAKGDTVYVPQARKSGSRFLDILGWLPRFI